MPLLSGLLKASCAYLFSNLEAGQWPEPHAGLGKLIPSIIAFSQVGHLPFSFIKVFLMTYYRPPKLNTTFRSLYVNEKKNKDNEETLVMGK